MIFPKSINENVGVFKPGVLDTYKIIKLYELRNNYDVRKFAEYIDYMQDKFAIVHNSVTAASSHFEMLMIAYTCYVLNSYNCMGNILECGYFKGFSSTCLSIICDYFDKELYVADSFQGLPENDDPYYKTGDFKG